MGSRLRTKGTSFSSPLAKANALRKRNSRSSAHPIYTVIFTDLKYVPYNCPKIFCSKPNQLKMASSDHSSTKNWPTKGDQLFLASFSTTEARRFAKLISLRSETVAERDQP